MSTTQNVLTVGNQMLEVLKHQHQLFLELVKLSREQREMIKSQQSEDLLHLLGKRQKIVEAINKIHQQSSDYRAEWPRLKELLPPVLRTQIGELLTALEQMLNAIIEQDKQDCQELSAGREQVAGALQQTAKGQAVGASYSGGYGSNFHTGGNFQITG